MSESSQPSIRDRSKATLDRLGENPLHPRGEQRGTALRDTLGVFAIASLVAFGPSIARELARGEEPGPAVNSTSLTYSGERGTRAMVDEFEERMGIDLRNGDESRLVDEMNDLARGDGDMIEAGTKIGIDMDANDRVVDIHLLKDPKGDNG